MLRPVLVLASVIAYACAANDWQTPCTAGFCAYEWDGDDNVAFSSMMLSGPQQVLSDITPAAGWQIMGCNPSWSKGSHDVRMVCAGTPAQMAQCEHLFDNGGAEETVVRLPQNCGTGPFARVQKVFVSQDQSVPDHIAKVARRAIRADGSSAQPEVHGITLDYDFSKVPTSRGKLVFGVTSSNAGSQPLTHRDLMALRKRGRARSTVLRRFGFPNPLKAAGDVIHKGASAVGNVVHEGESVAGAVVHKATSVAGDVAKGATSIAGDVAHKATSVAGAVANKATSVAGDVAHKATSVAGAVANKATSVAGDVAHKAENVAEKATSVAGAGFDTATSAVVHAATAAATAVVKGAKAVEDATTINKTDSSLNIPINFDTSFPLLDASIACEKGKVDGSATLQIDVDMKVDADVKFGYTFVGSIIPLKLDDAKIFSTMSGDASATFNIDASAQGTFDTGAVPLFKTGLPGLSIPGLLALGPEFSINTELVMELDVEAQMSVTADFTFPNIDFVFPKKEGKSSANANPKKTGNPLKLSTQESVDAKGTVSAHLIPRIDFGIDIGEGIAQGSVFLDMDFAGILEMEVQASTGAAKSSSGGSLASDLAKDVAKEKGAVDSASASAASAAKATAKTSSKSVAKSGARASRRATKGGCVTLSGKMSIDAGLDGKLQPVFDEEVKFPIFSTQVQLFQKCFGDGLAPAPKARSISGGSTVARRYKEPRIFAPRAAKTSGGTKNEITPEQSKASTDKLFCGNAVLPFGVLTALI